RIGRPGAFLAAPGFLGANPSFVASRAAAAPAKRARRLFLQRPAPVAALLAALLDDLDLAVVRAAVAADGVTVVALLALIHLQCPVAAAWSRQARRGATVVTADVHARAEIAPLAKQHVDLGVAAVPASDAAGRAAGRAV